MLQHVLKNCAQLSKILSATNERNIRIPFGCISAKKKFSTKNKNIMGRKRKSNEIASNIKTKPTASKSTQKIPANINLVVVGTGGPGTSKCLLLTTEYSRYMFNCGEGSQRLTVMNKCLKSFAYAKVSGIENIFVTHKSWENTGGLLGIAMLVESQKNPDIKNFAFQQKQKLSGANASQQNRDLLPELTLYGPEGVEKITMMARKFAERSNMDIVRKDGVYEDYVMKISPIIFTKKTQNMAAEEEEVSYAGAASSECKDEIYAYLCSAKPVPPKINVEKCVDVGITMGPMVGELQRGNSVILPDGTVIQPEQVTDVPTDSKNSCLVVECPTLDHMQSLMENEELRLFQEPLAIVVHMTPACVLNTDVYQQWMLSFGEETDHLVMNGEASPADLGRVRNHQAQLNVVDPNVFPLLPPIISNEMSTENNEVGKVRHGCSGMFYTIRGKNPGFHIETDVQDVTSIQQEILEEPEVKEQIENLKSLAPVAGSPYPKIVFLGTGSSEPNRIRAQSCIAVHLSSDNVMILDCGEDSFGQLFRFYGHDETYRILLKLKAIFISHMHGDHHLGLLTILNERRKAFDIHGIPFSPVLLMAPIQMKRMLKFYHFEVGHISDLFRFFKHQKNLKEFVDDFVMDSATEEDILNTLDLIQYQAVEVFHSRDSYGIVFTHQSGFKLVYSGDTRPVDSLVNAGQNCNLLIHEATHEDDLIPQAQFSRHSTFSEAMDVGKRMNAKHIILTHFSQRYPHMVPFYGMTVPENVGIAFDNMEVTQHNVSHLQKFISPLTHIFADKLQRLEIKNLKRNREDADLDTAV